ncbi:hypothetical protein [Lactobacillus hominis]|nr:hypothetical protein [Lactobacillus hominis]
MEIIDKINGNWQVGDKVQTDDGYKELSTQIADVLEDYYEHD